MDYHVKFGKVEIYLEGGFYANIFTAFVYVDGELKFISKIERSDRRGFIEAMAAIYGEGNLTGHNRSCGFDILGADNFQYL